MGVVYKNKDADKVCDYLKNEKADAVDSNGAGDVFHEAFAFSVSMGYNYYD